MISPVSTAQSPSPILTTDLMIRPKVKRPSIKFDFRQSTVPSPFLPIADQKAQEIFSENLPSKKMVTFGKKTTYRIQTSGKHGLPNSLLWWSEDEEISFRNERELEIKDVMKKNPDITHFEARRMLYEPKGQYKRVNPHVSYIEVLTGLHLVKS
jgi:hypothetical protein